MLIEYVGHSCFYIVNSGGTRALTDPYDNSIGLAPVSKSADIVLISHHHQDHDYLAGVRGGYQVFDKPGSYQYKDVAIQGFNVPHDAKGGTERGDNTAFLMETDGIRVLHMGDVGAMPDDSFFESAGRVDVLMVPIGGVFTVDAHGALPIVERLKPNITIPMHYKTTNLKLDIYTAREFKTIVNKKHDVSLLGSSKFEITAEQQKKRPRILFMENSY